VQRFQVTKAIEFCYGHRLLNHEGKCRFLHGHNGLVEVDVESQRLDALGMVVDFGAISDVVKAWIDENLDHRMLLHRDDPVLPLLQQQGEPIFVMDVNPTAESIAALIWQAANRAGLQVSAVRLWETASSRASYRGEPWNE
jgi:6-pyruvoyltetrahydropterin/6-carboxytetrahydropterin synthase